MQAEQQRERERFEAWYDAWIVEKRVHMTLKSEVWDAWQARAALSHPSTPQGWISVEDRLPAMDEPVLVYTPSSVVKVCFDEWCTYHEAPVSWSSATVETGEGWQNHEFEEVTHWMPLPPPPEQGSKG